SYPRGANTARACSDHEQIEIMVGHVVGSKPSGRAALDVIPMHQLRPSVRAIHPSWQRAFANDGLLFPAQQDLRAMQGLNRSTRDALDVVTSLFHFATHLGDNLLRETFGPGLRSLHALIEDSGLLGQQLAAERRLVEGKRVLEFLLGEAGGVE